MRTRLKSLLKNLMAWVLPPLLVVGLLPFLLGLPTPQVSTVAEPQEHIGVQVTYGSVLKLMHGTTKSRLHSLDIRYAAGGQHHVVTGFRGVHNSNSYWIVKPTEGSLSQQGDSIPNGSTIRLQHMQTHNWLHSRSHPSPISRNSEVSCRGGHDESDTGDLWRLEVVDKGEVWMKDREVRLKHVDTGSFLHSHEMMYTRVIPGQMEVCGLTDKTADSIWIASEGVYLHASTN